MSIRQIVCDIIERAIEDGLVAPRGLNEDDPAYEWEWEPHLIDDEELAGCFGLLRAWLRRHAADAAKLAEPPADAPVVVLLKDETPPA
jgi:hypothetical protein